MVRSSLAPKWSKTVPFCGMDHQKSNFLLISGSLSFGGCWGQPMVLFWKLVDETQISPPPEATRHHSLTKSWILLPLRAKSPILRQHSPYRTIFFFHIKQIEGWIPIKYGQFWSGFHIKFDQTAHCVVLPCSWQRAGTLASAGCLAS